MNFKAYDIISKLLPGLALVYSLIFLYGDFESYSNADYILPITVIAFFIGYLIDAISSWLEDFYYLTWKGKPSTRLLTKNKGVWKVTVPPYLNEVKIKVRELIGHDISDDEVFQFTQNSAYKSNKERISDFLQSYVFARVFLTLIIILAVLFATKYFCHWQFFAISLPMIFVSWLRAKQRAYYYAVEVLRVYFNSEMNNI